MVGIVGCDAKKKLQTGYLAAGDFLGEVAFELGGCGAKFAVHLIEERQVGVPCRLRDFERAFEPIGAFERKAAAFLAGEAAAGDVFPIGRVNNMLPDVLPIWRNAHRRKLGRDAAQAATEIGTVPGWFSIGTVKVFENDVERRERHDG